MTRKILKTYHYKPHKLTRGYTRKSLYINVGDLSVVEKDVSQMMIDKFVGGKGFDLYYLWHATKPDTKWNDPENEIVMSAGPLGGMTLSSGTGKTLV